MSNSGHRLRARFPALRTSYVLQRICTVLPPGRFGSPPLGHELAIRRVGRMVHAALHQVEGPRCELNNCSSGNHSVQDPNTHCRLDVVTRALHPLSRQYFLPTPAPINARSFHNACSQLTSGSGISDTRSKCLRADDGKRCDEGGEFHGGECSV